MKFSLVPIKNSQAMRLPKAVIEPDELNSHLPMVIVVPVLRGVLTHFECQLMCMAKKVRANLGNIPLFLRT